MELKKEYQNRFSRQNIYSWQFNQKCQSMCWIFLLKSKWIRIKKIVFCFISMTHSYFHFEISFNYCEWWSDEILNSLLGDFGFVIFFEDLKFWQISFDVSFCFQLNFDVVPRWNASLSVQLFIIIWHFWLSIIS